MLLILSANTSVALMSVTLNFDIDSLARVFNILCSASVAPPGTNNPVKVNPSGIMKYGLVLIANVLDLSALIS